MINIGFERIEPVPNYPDGTSAATLSGLTWSSGTNQVSSFKVGIKKALRKSQFARCCFCRRLMYHDYATHIEHFVDKGGYPAYTFEIRNLALSCGTCNTNKNGYFSTWAKRFSKRYMIRGIPYNAYCHVLKNQILGNVNFPTSSAEFRWVNPYVHNYSEHIEIKKGWFFHGKTPEGKRTIRGVKLNDVGVVEKRALSERLEARGGKLSMLVGALGELEQHRARDVVEVVVAAIKRRRQ